VEVRPGYKQTEVGVVPEDWDVKPIRDVLREGRLGGNYANQDQETEAPLMKMGNIARGHIDLSKVEYIPIGAMPDNQHRLVFGDVLFNTRNTLDLVGKVAIWREELPVAYYNSNLMRLEFDPALCSNEYANYALNTAAAIARFRALATGTTSVAAIYSRDLLGVPLTIPPISEQRAIAQALGDADALLSTLASTLAKKRDLKQAAMQQLLTGQARLPGFHGEWSLKMLGDLFTFSGGYSASRDQLSADGRCYLHYGDIHKSSKPFVDVQAEPSVPMIARHRLPRNYCRGRRRVSQGWRVPGSQMRGAGRA
jgi:type I restriction enzyme S subunit